MYPQIYQEELDKNNNLAEQMEDYKQKLTMKDLELQEVSATGSYLTNLTDTYHKKFKFTLRHFVFT